MATDDARQRVYLGPWRIDVVRRAGIASPLSAGAIARATAAALDTTNPPDPGSVTVVLTDDDELADLNRAHMGVDGPTDVLSFPMLPQESFDRGAAAPGRRARKGWAAVGRRPRSHLGDIAISVERAIEQADQGRGGQTGDVRWSAADELRLLVTHGTLHLCGWDHAEQAEERAMRSLEQQLLG
jgi:probable rRNA maturation factor